MRFLVVDDSRAMQSIIRRGLKKAGHDQIEIKLANDGIEALDIIKVWEPDMVLSDWHMPNMTGMELLLAIKQQMLNVPMGLVTTETSEVRIREALEAGALFVINKPFDDEQLLATVLNALQKQPPRRREAEPVDTIEGQDLQMPTSQSFAQTVNAIAQHDILVEAIDPISLQDKLMPCVLGLYEDEKKKSRAVVVLDLRAAAILGAAVAGATPQEVRQSIAEQKLGKNLVEGCKAILKATGEVVSDSATSRSLYLRSVNLIPAVFPKLESIYARSEIARSDFEVAVAGYGQGLVTLIAT